MSRASAVRTGWLSHRSSGCEVASPVPVTYRLDGARAPRALNGSAEFSRGRLRTLTFGGGVRTTVGVRVGSTSTELLSRYRAAGFTATSRYEELFDATFLTVKRQRRQVLGALADHGRVTVALAGHPPPLLARDGQVEVVQVPGGPALGIYDHQYPWPAGVVEVGADHLAAPSQVRRRAYEAVQAVLSDDHNYERGVEEARALRTQRLGAREPHARRHCLPM